MNCLFCRIGQKQVPTEMHPENEILFQSQRFYVKAALGHFVQGYCLVIPNEHVQTISELEVEECVELESVIDEVADRLRKLYKAEVCVFEHGAACLPHRAGACIDHAHLHVLPVDCDLSADLMTFPRFDVSHFTDLRQFSIAAQSYIYYEYGRTRRAAYLCNARVPSQFIRRLLCERMNADREWDWRLAPYFEDIERFIEQWVSATPAKRSLVIR